MPEVPRPQLRGELPRSIFPQRSLPRPATIRNLVPGHLARRWGWVPAAPETWRRQEVMLQPLFDFAPASQPCGSPGKLLLIAALAAAAAGTRRGERWAVGGMLEAPPVNRGPAKQRGCCGSPGSAAAENAICGTEATQFLL